MSDTFHNSIRARWIAAAAITAVMVAAVLLTQGGTEPAPEASTPPAPVMTVVPVTVAGAKGCLQERGFKVKKTTARSVVVTSPQLKRAAVLVTPNEETAKQAAEQAAGTGWEAVANTRIRLTGETAVGRAELLACLKQSLTPAG